MKEPKLCVDFYNGCEYCPGNMSCPDKGKPRDELLKLAIKKELEKK